MVGTRRCITRRDAALALAAMPLAACNPLPSKPPQPSKAGGDTGDIGAGPNALAELTRLSPDIHLDIRYATKANFTGRILYDQPRAFLVTAAAQAILRASAAAKADGFGLLIHDAYRPWSVTKKLWDATPKAKRGFVADPKQGSRHNRGCAVDLSLYDRATGMAAEMPSDYDEFSARAYRSYDGASTAATRHRAQLESYMQAEGFIGISNEWWHFDYKDWAQYPIMDVPFSAL
jgi:D-alanyl-D-alanine dipeptidase